MASSVLRGVIDLGTNTFHLLIAEVGPGGILREVYRERRFVKLASEGIEYIGEAPFGRGLETMSHFAGVLQRHGVSRVTAIGTAALRRAENGAAFMAEVMKQTGLTVQLISGDAEARLITEGVLAALPPLEERLLIMDIGGGSVEYIIVENDTVRWRRSFPIGISVLYRLFHRSEPISPAERSELQAYLSEQTHALTEALARFPTEHLAGAAGNFDVLAERLLPVGEQPGATSHRLDFTPFPDFLERLVSSDAEARALIPGVPAERVDMIVVAMLLIDFTVRIAGIRRVTVSQYALKEGVLLEGT